MLLLLHIDCCSPLLPFRCIFPPSRCLTIWEGSRTIMRLWHSLEIRCWSSSETISTLTGAQTHKLFFFFCFLDSLTHYVRPDPMICQPHLFKILLKTFLLRIICLFFTCVFMVCIFLFCFYVLCLHMIMFIITVDGKCLIFYVKKVQNVQFIKIDFTYSLISALCDFSDIVFLFLGCLFLFLRCSIRCLLTTPLKSSPHKRSECCNSFVWKMCMISVRAIFFFSVFVF